MNTDSIFTDSPVRIDHPRHRVAGVFDHATANLLSAFPDCLLIPVADVSKLDAQLHQLPLATEVQSAAFKTKLAAASHIAVVLGPRSNGLFVIRFQTFHAASD